MKVRGFLWSCARAAALLLPMALLGCQGIEVKSAYGPGIRFDGMGKTWDWAPEAKMGLRNELTLSPEHDALLKRLISEELARKGYVQQEKGQADLAVDYAVTRGSRGGLRESTFSPVRTEGSLVIDMLDPATGKHIWRGYAHTKLLDSSDPVARKERITLATRLILERFPDAGK